MAVAGAVSLAGLGVLAATSPLGAVAAATPRAARECRAHDRRPAQRHQGGAQGPGNRRHDHPGAGRPGRDHTQRVRGPARRSRRQGVTTVTAAWSAFHGGFALDAAAEALGITAEELRTALGEGKTLAQIAETEGVETDALVEDLVAAATERIKQAVTDERLTQERADELIADAARADRHGGGGGLRRSRLRAGRARPPRGRAGRPRPGTERGGPQRRRRTARPRAAPARPPDARPPRRNPATARRPSGAAA